MRSLTRIFIAALSALAATAPALAQDPFYKGKRVTLLVNFAAGSATDVDARVFARHFARQLAGEPDLVVQNMEGAGGLTGATYVGEIAPGDGSVIGFLTSMAWGFASRPETFRLDFRKYQFAGFSGGATVYYARTDIPPGLKRPADLVKATSVISGGVAAHSGRDLSIRLTLDILGVNSRHVTGYNSGNRARLALQRNEIGLYADTIPGYRSAVEPVMEKDGSVIPLYFDPLWDGATFGVDSQARELKVLPFQEFYRSVNNGQMPSGKLWESYLALIALNGSMQRIIALPPAAPPAAVDAVRAAIKRMNSDKDFAADAMKAFGYVPEYYAETDAAAKIRNALSVRPEIRDFIADYTVKGISAAK